MTKTSRRSRSPRGSGDLLADEIIDAATHILGDTDDIAAVSIRAVADRVGVTPPSIYLHFTDKDALLDAVCAGYFERLDTRMADAVAGVSDPVERLLRHGKAYVEFALANPVVYRQAFQRAPASGTSKVDEILTAAAYMRLSDSVQELADAGVLDVADVGDIVLELWAAAHGIASLMISKPFLNWGDGLAVADGMLRSAFLGRVVTGTAPTAPADLESVRAMAARIAAGTGADSLVKRR